MKKTLITIVVFVAMLAGWMVLKNKGDLVVNTPTPIISPIPTPLVSPESTPTFQSEPRPSGVGALSPSPVVSKNIITYTDSGYTPQTITIKKGEVVVWKNKSSISMWTASAVHPLHRGYPGTDIMACGTLTLLPMFDACQGIGLGQSWAFKFDNVGTWGYHNHLKASDWGKVIVE